MSVQKLKILILINRIKYHFPHLKEIEKTLCNCKQFPQATRAFNIIALHAIESTAIIMDGNHAVNHYANHNVNGFVNVFCQYILLTFC